MSKDIKDIGTTPINGEEQPYGSRPLFSEGGLDKEQRQALREYESELAESEKPAQQEENSDEETVRQASEKVARLNSIFDRLMLPIIIFTVLVIIGAGLLPKACASCSGDTLAEIDSAVLPPQTVFSFYSARAKLLENIAPYREILQGAGYFIMEDEENSEEFIAYKQLDSGLEIMENVIDSQGTHYTALMLEQGEGEQKTAVTLMVYTENVMLAVAERGEDTRSAVFDSGIMNMSASNTDAVAVFEYVSADTLSSMQKQYEQEMEKLLRG
ncbi:MAG: hypothetical protein E7559_10075 [Ruminococcaceae bacterium]|nr:hypothetical protein [Oscillospiraceae bacterium]